MLFKKGVETKIVGMRKILKILKFKASLFLFFNVEEEILIEIIQAIKFKEERLLIIH